jgi:hypothetical protein
MSISIHTGRAALQAREVAAAYYLNNPRVRLIDVGLKIKEGLYTGQTAVRFHLRNKHEQATFEEFSLRNEDLVIDKSKIPFEVDLIEANYQLHWSWLPAPENKRSKYFDPLRGGISVSSEWLYGFGTLGGIVQDGVTEDPMIPATGMYWPGRIQASNLPARLWRCGNYSESRLRSPRNDPNRCSCCWTDR